MTMTKKTLAELMHDELGYNKVRSAALVESVLGIIAETLEQGEDVLLSGFGKFDVNEKHERNGRNPHTGNQMMLPARKVVGFRTSRNLKKALNGSGHNN